MRTKINFNLFKCSCRNEQEQGFRHCGLGAKRNKKNEIVQDKNLAIINAKNLCYQKINYFSLKLIITKIILNNIFVVLGLQS